MKGRYYKLNYTLGPRYCKWGEWDANCLYPVTHNLTFEFDSTERINRMDVSVINGFPWALRLHTNKCQLSTCGISMTETNSERGERLLGIVTMY